MFTKEELRLIDKHYFKSIKITEHYLLLRSRCTGHYWYILEEFYPSTRTFHLFHKHKKSNDFHPQRSKLSKFKQAIDCIQDHDFYQLNVRNK